LVIVLPVLGFKMVMFEPFLGVICLLVLIVLLFRYPSPVALIVLVLGTTGSLLMHGGVMLPSINLGLHLPQLIVPTYKDFENGILMLVLPQLPLTLTNAVLVTSLISQELFPQHAERTTEKNLCLTMGGANLLLAPFGGYMMCHGSGGVAAHYRYGGRTARTVYIIGAILLLFGVLLGDDAVLLLGLIPEAVLGALLFYSGIDLAMAARSSNQRQDIFIILLTAALTVGVNPAIAFITGLMAELALRRSWIKLS